MSSSLDFFWTYIFLEILYICTWIVVPKKEKPAEETIFLPSSMKEIKVLPIGFFFSNPCYKWTIIINFYSVELSFNTVGDFDLFVFFVIYGTMTEIPLAIEC